MGGWDTEKAELAQRSALRLARAGCPYEEQAHCRPG